MKYSHLLWSIPSVRKVHDLCDSCLSWCEIFPSYIWSSGLQSQQLRFIINFEHKAECAQLSCWVGWTIVWNLIFTQMLFLSFDLIFFLRLVCKVKSVKAEFCVSSPCIKKMKFHLQKYRKMSLFSVIYGLKKMVMWKKTDCTYSESVSMSKSSKKALC